MSPSGKIANMAQAHAGVSPAEARAIAVDAYIYFYPVLSMDISRKQFTNIDPGREFGKGPMNRFVSFPEYPPAAYECVMLSNSNTLYSIAWLDLSHEPLVVATPDTDGRFYLLWMLDLWTDVFASPGWRTSGTGTGNFLVTPPDWTVTVPEGVEHLPAPASYVWVIGRIKTSGPQDYAAVHKIQEGFKVTPLSEWRQPPLPAPAAIELCADPTTPAKGLLDSMPAGDYFAYAAELLKLHAPDVTDRPMIARLKKIGMEPGKSFDIGTLEPDLRAALEAAPGEAQELMNWQLPTLARVMKGWSMNTDTMGVYGNYYLRHAIARHAVVAQQRLLGRTSPRTHAAR
ncbi:MAG: hypothetical protein QOH19_432 [Actinomycetota bacterium]|nr:hypothetical protein [Actinomycetota bacterium]